MKIDIVKEYKLGDLNITLDTKQLKEHFQTFIQAGSFLEKLLITDLTIHLDADVVNKFTFEDLIKNGTKYFDALIFCGLAKGGVVEDEAEEIKFDKEDEKYSKINFISAADGGMPVPIDTSKLSDHAFIVYFTILTQNNPPALVGEGRPTPKFLKTLMSEDYKLEATAQFFASFELKKMNFDWIQSIEVRGFSAESKSRFMLGVAGHRHLQAIANLKPTRADVDKQIATVHTLIAEYLKAGPFWDMHPRFRPPTFTKDFISLAKNLMNYIVDAYSEEERLLMLKNKFLYSKKANPTLEDVKDAIIAEPQYTHWKDWDATTFKDYRANKIAFT